MAEKSVSVQVGPGFAGTLTLIFIVLKLLGKIDWTWWWVLSPLWISAAVGIAIWAFIFVIFIIAAIVGEK